jgi:hypothetical protein
MIDKERPTEKDTHIRESIVRLTHELLRLVLILIWKFTIWLLRKMAKGLLWCLQTIEKGWVQLNVWWNDNDTQAKVAKIKAGLRKAAATLAEWSKIACKEGIKGTKIGAAASWKGLKIASKATLQGIIIGFKATIQGIIHLRSTSKKIGQLVQKGTIATWKWIKRCWRSMKFSHIKRKRAYQEFRRNGGIKGSLVKTSHHVKQSIEIFMEEDQEEATAEAVTEDDLMEEVLEEGANEGRKSMRIGKSFIARAKNFMDAE